VVNRSTNRGACPPIGLRPRIQRGDEQVPQHALVTALFGPNWFTNEAEVDRDNPAGEGIGRKTAANLAGSRGSLEAPDERVSEFGPPQLGAFGSVIGDTEGLMIFDQ
jgi:hypothetical protein